MPVIASLNGSVAGRLAALRALIKQAGADALELNIYTLATDPREDGAHDRRAHARDGAHRARRRRACPLAVKLSPFYTSLGALRPSARRAGPDGLVLFNRFYQPGIDIEELEVRRELHLSDSSELPLRLRWLAILSGASNASLAVTGGVHTVDDVVQSVMAGRRMPCRWCRRCCATAREHLATLRAGSSAWLEEHEYESLRQTAGQHEPARAAPTRRPTSAPTTC